MNALMLAAGAATATNWGSVADWVVAATAVAGAVFAGIQLRRVAQANQGQVDIARAELMLEIDGRFESEHMLASRIKIQTLRNHCERRARQEHPDVPDGDMRRHAAELFSREVTALYKRFRTADVEVPIGTSLIDLPDDKDGPAYFELMRLPYWMETVGELSRAELLPLEEVLNLYDAVFVGILGCFDGHILYRRTAAPLQNEQFLEHAIWLKHMAEARRENESREAERKRQPRRTGLFQTPSLLRMR